MPGTPGPRLGLVWGYAPGEAGWGVGGFNPNFQKLEALVHLTVVSITTTPPATPANGDCYIVGVGGTGVWAGHNSDVAVWYTTGGWLYIDPAIGVRAYNRATSTYWRYDGSAWIQETVPSANVSGPASATDANIVIFDGATGKIIRDGGQSLPDGFLVGTTDDQVLTNKIIEGASNSLTVRLEADVTGNLPIARLGGGTGASATTYWRGDGTWSAPASESSGGASVTVSDMSPATPVVGDLWFDGVTLQLFVWVSDDTSSQWIVAVNQGASTGGIPGVLSLTTGEGLTSSASIGDVHVELECPIPVSDGGTGAETATQALVNLGAAPLYSAQLLGTPTAPTASPGVYTGQIATTAFVANALSAGVSGVASITAGAGLTGGGIGDVTLGLETPVSVVRGGTGATSPSAALGNLNGLSLSGGTLTGDLRAPSFTAQDAGGTQRILVTANWIGWYNHSGTSVGLIGNSDTDMQVLCNTGNFTVVGNEHIQGNHLLVHGTHPLLALWDDGAGIYGIWSQNDVLNFGAVDGNVIPQASRMRLDEPGNLTVDGTLRINSTCYNTSGVWNTISTDSLKTDIVDYTSGLGEVMKLRPVTFRYNGPAQTLAADDGQTHIGMLVSEVEPVMPELIGEIELQEHGTVQTLSGTLLVYALVNAVKTLASENEQLITRLDALEAAR